ncbi:hypothetical protein HK102_012811 [Quaeritorhiza haematococci]|nr:hypothetical protein HK102_012811 [Quaeritorhiza haematococci]
MFDSDGEENSEPFRLTINESFAKKYEHKKRQEELSQLRDKYGEEEAVLAMKLDRKQRRPRRYEEEAEDDYDDEDDEDSESDEEEDEVGELVTPEVDAQILKTIAKIRSRDPSVYDSQTNFFTEEEIKKAHERWQEKQRALKSSEKPMHLKDYHRMRLLDGEAEDEEEGGNKKTDEDAILPHSAEQEKLKDEFKMAIDGAFEQTDDADDGFLKIRNKSQDELDQEEEEYRKFLLDVMTAEGDKGLKEWKDFMDGGGRVGEGKQVDENEVFLMEYILNRGWVDKDATRIPTYNEIVDDDEDEDAVEEAEEFERQYNFRFEEEGGAQIVTHARNIPNSVRRKDDKRARQREEREARKKEEKVQKMEELKRLKNLKKMEILEKLKKIQEMAGFRGDIDGAFDDEDGSQGKGKSKPKTLQIAGLDEIDLEEDFDPEKYDQKMSRVFGDDYYEDGDAVKKPDFGDDIDISDIVPSAAKDDFGVDYDQSQGDDENFIMDADYLPGGELYDEAGGKPKSKKQERREKKKEKKKQKRALEDLEGGDYEGYGDDAVDDEHAEGEPSNKKAKMTLNEYLDEYYQLDYEDMIGDIPTRFKYTKVEPDSFGLNPVEILMADDADLNTYLSLKKLAPFRRPDVVQRDMQKFRKSKKKRLREFRKKLEEQAQADGVDLSGALTNAGGSGGNGRKSKDGANKGQDAASKTTVAGTTGKTDGAKAGKKKKKKEETEVTEETGDRQHEANDGESGEKKKKKRKHCDGEASREKDDLQKASEGSEEVSTATKDGESEKKKRKKDKHGLGGKVFGKDKTKKSGKISKERLESYQVK